MILDFVAGKVARLPWALPCVTGVGFVGLLGFFWEGVGGVVFFFLSLWHVWLEREYSFYQR